MRTQKIIIGIGGNIKSEDGDHPIKVAIKAISYLKDYSINITDQSSWYETEPIPKSDQPNFFNCIVFAKTALKELDVLKSLHEIEYRLGRKRILVNEPRAIDLDLIDYSNKILRNKETGSKQYFLQEILFDIKENENFNLKYNKLKKKN